MSARRQARGRQETSHEIDGVAVPGELLDGNHRVWCDRGAYLDWMSKHGLSRMTARDRVGAGGHPANRRNCAADEWAAAHGIALEPQSNPPRASWHALRRLGLID